MKALDRIFKNIKFSQTKKGTNLVWFCEKYRSTIFCLLFLLKFSALYLQNVWILMENRRFKSLFFGATFEMKAFFSPPFKFYVVRSCRFHLHVIYFIVSLIVCVISCLFPLLDHRKFKDNLF